MSSRTRSKKKGPFGSKKYLSMSLRELRKFCISREIGDINNVSARDECLNAIKNFAIQSPLVKHSRSTNRRHSLPQPSSVDPKRSASIKRSKSKSKSKSKNKNKNNPKSTDNKPKRRSRKRRFDQLDTSNDDDDNDDDNDDKINEFQTQNNKKNQFQQKKKKRRKTSVISTPDRSINKNEAPLPQHITGTYRNADFLNLLNDDSDSEDDNDPDQSMKDVDNNKRNQNNNIIQEPQPQAQPRSVISRLNTSILKESSPDSDSEDDIIIQKDNETEDEEEEPEINKYSSSEEEPESEEYSPQRNNGNHRIQYIRDRDDKKSRSRSRNSRSQVRKRNEAKNNSRSKSNPKKKLNFASNISYHKHNNHNHHFSSPSISSKQKTTEFRVQPQSPIHNIPHAVQFSPLSPYTATHPLRVKSKPNKKIKISPPPKKQFLLSPTKKINKLEKKIIKMYTFNGIFNSFRYIISILVYLPNKLFDFIKLIFNNLLWISLCIFILLLSYSPIKQLIDDSQIMHMSRKDLLKYFAIISAQRYCDTGAIDLTDCIFCPDFAECFDGDVYCKEDKRFIHGKCIYDPAQKEEYKKTMDLYALERLSIINGDYICQSYWLYSNLFNDDIIINHVMDEMTLKHELSKKVQSSESGHLFNAVFTQFTSAIKTRNLRHSNNIRDLLYDDVLAGYYTNKSIKNIPCHLNIFLYEYKIQIMFIVFVAIISLIVIIKRNRKKYKTRKEKEKKQEIIGYLRNYTLNNKQQYIPIDIIKARLGGNNEDNGNDWKNIQKTIQNDPMVVTSARMIDGVQKLCWSLSESALFN